MSVERSERGVLTTNASYKKTDEQFSLYGLLPNSWTQEDNYTITYRVGVQPSPPSDSRLYFNYAEFAPSTTPDYNLEWAVVIYYPNNANSIVSESSWYPVNTTIHFTCPSLTGNQYFRFKIYLRRALDENGDRPQLSRTSMNSAGITFYGNLYYNEEQQTLPSDWFQTTTQTIPTYTTQTTMLTTVDYDSYLSTLTVPADVRPAIAQLDQLINDLWSLHYIPFVVCFALIMGLAIWLLH